MITVENEDMVIGTAIHNLPTAPFNGSLISKDSRKKIVHGNIFTSVILTKQKNPPFQRFKNMLYEYQRARKHTFGTPL